MKLLGFGTGNTEGQGAWEEQLWEGNCLFVLLCASCALGEYFLQKVVSYNNPV